MADRNDATVSLASSIGPPGSASEIATPTTSGARRTRVHSSSVKSCLDVMATSWERDTSLREKPSFPCLSEGSPSADDGDRHRLLQACPTGPDGPLSPALLHLVIRDGRSTGMRQRTLQASTVAFLLGLVISVVWSFLHTSGF